MAMKGRGAPPDLPRAPHNREPALGGGTDWQTSFYSEKTDRRIYLRLFDCGLVSRQLSLRNALRLPRARAKKNPVNLKSASRS